MACRCLKPHTSSAWTLMGSATLPISPSSGRGVRERTSYLAGLQALGSEAHQGRYGGALMAILELDPSESGGVDAYADPLTNNGRYPSGQATRPLRILIVATEAPPVHGGIARIVGYLRDGF